MEFPDERGSYPDFDLKGLIGVSGAFLYKKANRRILANSSRSESMLGKGATGVGINRSPRESTEYWEVESVLEERLVTRFSGGGVLNRRKRRSLLILEGPEGDGPSLIKKPWGVWWD